VGYVGVQYPPGTAITLALFPEGEAVHWLNWTVIWLFLAIGCMALIMAGARGSWVSAGFVSLALELGLGILGRIGSMSFSINAMLAPLLLSLLCLSAACGWNPEKMRWRAAWFLSLLSGCFLGFAILIRLPIIFLIPGVLVLLWPASWRLPLRQPIFAFGLGMLFIGILPLILHQYAMTGAWYLPTYSRFDTVPPSLEPLPANLVYYLGTGPGSQDNWAIVVLLVGVVGLIALSNQRRPNASVLGWTRHMAAVLILWGLPTAYFLTHPITIPYYTVPATFGAVTLLALGAFTIESLAVAPRWPRGDGRLCLRGWIALAIALLPGITTVGYALSSYAQSVNSPQVQAHQFMLPAELSPQRGLGFGQIC
jgi:hypothetical protein